MAKYLRGVDYLMNFNEGQYCVLKLYGSLSFLKDETNIHISLMAFTKRANMNFFPLFA